MNDVIAYLMSRPNIQNVVLLVGKGVDAGFIRELCLAKQLHALDIFFNTADKKELTKALSNIFKEKDCLIPSRVEPHACDELSTFSADDENFALVYVEPDSMSYLLECATLRPKYLCGEAYCGGISAFNIWEAYRTVCDEMYLLTHHADSHDEALLWEKRPDNDIELSVVFPMYNVAKYLPECIASVLAWKADYVEYLFVDDGSPDNCAQIVEAAAKSDPRIKLLRKENGGCASARQYGMERSKGRYIGFVDPDDYIDESMFKKLFARAMMGSYDISYCGYNELYEDSGKTRRIQDMIGAPYCHGIYNSLEIKNLSVFLRVAIWRGIYSADMLRRNRIHFYTDLRRFDDLPFRFEVFSAARSAVSVPEYLYYYRLARPGQDVSADDERLYVHFPIFAYLDAFVMKKETKEQIANLQIVKLHTHIFTLTKLKPQYVKDYLSQAKKDLLSNMSAFKSFLVYRKAVAKKDKLYFAAICLRSSLLVKMLNKRTAIKTAKSRKNNRKTLKKLRDAEASKTND